MASLGDSVKLPCGLTFSNRLVKVEDPHQRITPCSIHS